MRLPALSRLCMLESGAFEEYIACLETASASSEDSEARKDAFCQIATVYEVDLKKRELAFAYYRRAFHEEPRDETVRREVERLAKETNAMEELLAFYQDEVDLAPQRDLELFLRRRIAKIYADDLEEHQSAIDEYNRILDLQPGDPEGLQALEPLYRSLGSFSSLADVYRQRIAQTDEPDARANLLRSFARLQANELKDAPGAITSLRKLLDVEPNDLAALEELSGLCAKLGRNSELADILEHMIEVADEQSPTEIGARFELAKLKAERLGDVKSAHQMLRAILEHDPLHVGARQYLQDRLEDALSEDDLLLVQSTGEILVPALRQSEDWDVLISVLRAWASSLPSGEERTPLFFEIATIYQEKLKQPGPAFSTLSQAFLENPAHSDVRALLHQVASEALLEDKLADVLESGVERIEDAKAYLQASREIAHLVENEIKDRERAFGAWQRVIQRCPRDPEALEALDRLCVALGRWAALVDILEGRIELCGEDQNAKHTLTVRLGELWDKRLDEPEEAVACYRKARLLEPDDKTTLKALAGLLGPADGEELYEVLEILHGNTKDEARQTELLAKMAKLAADPLGQKERAIELWQQVLAAEPKHKDALEALELLYEETARWAELSDHLETSIKHARSDELVTRLQRKLAFIQGTRLGSLDDAIEAWKEILKRNPNDLEAMTALSEVYQKAERWDETAHTLRKLIPLQSDTTGIKEIRFLMAEIFLTRLNRPDDAIESAKRVLDVEPHTPMELIRLEEIFAQTGAFGEVVRVMNERAKQAEDDGTRIDILFDVALVYESKLHRRAGAIAAYEEVLKLAPSSTKAYDALDRIYESNGDYRKLVDLYNRRIATTHDSTERQRMLLEVVRIQETRLGLPELAFSGACRALSEEGSDESVQTLAERLAGETDNWEILAEVYSEQIERVGLERGAELRCRLGEIYADHLADWAGAESEFEKVLMTRPGHPAAYARLGEIFEMQERWQDLISHLNDGIAREERPDKKKAIYRRVAEVQEKRLHDIDGAISSIRRVLDLDPSDEDAPRELIRILRETERWHALLKVMQREYEKADESSQLEILYDMAGIWEKGVENTDQAIEAYGDVLALNERHLPSLKALERLYSLDERWTELVDVFERQVALSADRDETARLLMRVASIWEDQFRDLEGASNTLVRVLELREDHLPAIRGLERVWRQAEEWEQLVGAYQRHLKLVDDKTERVGLFAEIASVYLEGLNQVEKAKEAYERALGVDPVARSVIRALGELHEREEDWPSALEMIDREIELVDSGPELVKLHFRMAHIRDVRLGERSAAKNTYRRILELDGAFVPALAALTSIHEAEGDSAGVVELKEKHARAVEDGDARAELYYEAGELSLDALDDPSRALELYGAAVSVVPGHVPALRALSELHFAREEWARAERFMKRLVEALDPKTDQEELCRQHYNLAYIAEKLGKDAEALKAYRASHELDSTYLPTLEGLAAALIRVERWGEAQRILQSILVHHKSALTDAEIADLHYQLGGLGAELGELESAQESFQRALDIDRRHLGALRALPGLFEKKKEWEEAYDLRERLLDQLGEEERFDEFVKQAELCRDRIREPYRAIDAFQGARRLRPKDVSILRAMVPLLADSGQTHRAIEVLQDLARALEDAGEKREVYLKLAGLFLTDQKEPDKAVKALNSALDIDSSDFSAFGRIEEILTKERNWSGLEANYQRMIQRLPKDQREAKAILWNSLGDLYDRVLKRGEDARIAYEVVLKLDPLKHEVAFRLADICSRKKDSLGKAVDIYHHLFPLVRDPSRPARALFKLYYEMKLLDQAFCALAALRLMRVASDEERQAHRKLLKRVPSTPKNAITDHLWQTVLHPDCRNSLAQICSVVYRGAPELFGEKQKALRLSRRKEYVDLGSKKKNARAGLRYFSIWSRLANAMHVGQMEHYHRPGSTLAPRFFPGEVPALVAGTEHEVFKDLPARRMVWELARQMATGRPELAPVRALRHPAEVGAALEGAIRLWQPKGSGIDLHLDARAVEDWRAQLNHRLGAPAREALKAPVERCLAKKEMKRLSKFIEGAEHTASRAALLMCGDVEVAEAGLQDQSDLLVGVSVDARTRALMLFALSSDYFRLRERLGLTVR